VHLCFSLGPWESGGTACFPDHEFIFTKPNDPDEVYASFYVTSGVSVYYWDPFTPDDDEEDLARGASYTEDVLDIDSLSKEDRAMYRRHKYNLQFAEMYKNFTGGSEWLSMYPRNPPRHPIWRADYFGQEHHVRTPHTQFHDIPPNLDNMSTQQMKNASATDYADYRAPGTLNLTLKAISCAPRAFAIEGFLSDVEADHILEIVQRRNDLIRSTTGGHLSETRTSRTTWIPRASDAVLDAVFRRVADTLRLDEALLRPRLPGEHAELDTPYSLNEDLQIVHYAKGQQYTAHHDFGFPKGLPDSPSRSINLCMYLNDVEQGGQTSFPRWRNAETTGPRNMTPKKGTAMIFYMVNPDGNLDDLSHHAALPVIEGEKWFSNLWIWDPVRL
jgi:prolyl 4-hydroxylase